MSLASKEDVEERLALLIGRLGADDEAARTLHESLPERRILSLHVTDLDERYWAEMAQGRIGPLQRGAAEDADIRISSTSDELVKLADGGGSVFAAYVAGRVRIQASFSDLMRLRRFTS